MKSLRWMPRIWCLCLRLRYAQHAHQRSKHQITCAGRALNNVFKHARLHMLHTHAYNIYYMCRDGSRPLQQINTRIHHSPRT